MAALAPNPPATPPPAPSLEPSPLQNLSFFASLLYVFAVAGMTEELSLTRFGFRPHLPTLSAVVALCGTGVSCMVFLPRMVRFPATARLLLYALMMILAVPFSVYRRGSFDLVSEYSYKVLIMSFLLVMTVLTWRQFRWLFHVMTVCTLMLVAALRSASFDVDSERLSFTEGRLGNPNDLATHLLTLLPFVIALFFLSSRFSPLRLISFAATIGSLITILSTGSRGGLVTLIICAAVLMIKIPSHAARLVMICCSALGLAGALAVLPQSVLIRYSLIFSSNAEPTTKLESAAIGSSESRRELLIQSIKMSLSNPVLGVGPGQFQTAENETSRREGRRGSWLQTHNAYTQVSSEIGIPAFLFFIGIFISALRTLSRLHRRLRQYAHLRQLALASFALYFSVLAFGVSAFFASLAYTFYIPMLAGLTTAFYYIADREIAAADATART